MGDDGADLESFNEARDDFLRCFMESKETVLGTSVVSPGICRAEGAGGALVFF